MCPPYVLCTRMAGIEPSAKHIHGKRLNSSHASDHFSIVSNCPIRWRRSGVRPSLCILYNNVLPDIDCPTRAQPTTLSHSTYNYVKLYPQLCQTEPTTMSNSTHNSVKLNPQLCQTEPTTMSNSTHNSVTLNLQLCQTEPTTLSN
ncbi:hypothetical protein RRG08_045532 [Elysia crispata]|uniref:Uncharacterized protein n=1 Tax=Elysia crispata TaxID=231223 RepID=A0AAE0YET9_9GAST|nr:hypothetical protein RRG08_045532 [Elysia crispata]